MSDERLQKILSNAGIASRREAERIILEGKVSVNGKIVNELGTKASIENDNICVDNQVIHLNTRKIYVLLNKPKKIISSTSDNRGRKTVIDLISDVKDRIYPVGRLDFDSEGLIILTNDGTLKNALLNPKYKINKTYIVKIKGSINENQLDKIRKGIDLDDGRTMPAIIDLIEKSDITSKIKITIFEGKNRQIRRMLACIGYEVISLKRIEFANLNCYKLKSGQYRHLTQLEIKQLYDLTGLKQ